MNTGINSKEQLILDHYKTIIESNSFDEYDIMGFLIFIRERIQDQKKYEAIHDFCHLIAHRGRNRGIVMNCITSAIDSDYHTIPGTNIVEGYHGVSPEQWNDEWKELGKSLRIVIDEDTIKELVLCIMSLSQDCCYKDKMNHIGYTRLSIVNDGLALVTTEGKSFSPYVTFTSVLLQTINECRYEHTGYIINEPVETRRDNGVLRLMAPSGYIV